MFLWHYARTLSMYFYFGSCKFGMSDLSGYCYNLYEAENEGHDWATLFLQKFPIWIDGWRQAEWDVGRPDIWEAENADWFYGCSEPSQNFPCKEIPSLYCKHVDQLDLSSSRRNLDIAVQDTALDYSKSVYLKLLLFKYQNKIADILFRNLQLKGHWEIKRTMKLWPPILATRLLLTQLSSLLPCSWSNFGAKWFPLHWS